MPKITYSTRSADARRFGEYAGQFFAVDENIVGPFDRGLLRDEALDHFSQSHRRRQCDLRRTWAGKVADGV